VRADQPLAAFARLPTRIYLDTSVLRRLYDFGALVWESEPFDPLPRAARVPHLREDLDALRRILEVKDRAHFEFVVTEASLSEVKARGRTGYTQWVRDVEESWLTRSQGVEYELAELERVGSVSRKDWALVLAAAVPPEHGSLSPEADPPAGRGR